MPKLTEENQIKLFILYLMDRIAYPLTYSDLQDAVWMGEFVSYFDFQTIFTILENEKNIARSDTEPPLYSLTKRGAQIVENLTHLLDYEVRDKGLKAALKYLQFKKTGADVAVSVVPGDKGSRLTLNIHEKGIEKMSLNVYLQDEQLARNMAFTARERPEVIYRGILALLAGDVDFLPLE